MTGTAAIVLAGGRSSRMGGSKPELLVGGISMLAGVLRACADIAADVIVVGVVAVPPGVRHLVEDPPGAGPVHAIACAVAEVEHSRCLVLAVDLPFLRATVLDELGNALRNGGDVAVAVDDQGRRQFLLALWRTASLRAQIGALDTTVNASLRSLFASADVRETRLSGDPPPWWDCDTPEALAVARAWTGGSLG